MLTSVLIFSFIFKISIADPWPIPYQPVPFRPKNDPYCQAGLVPFCPGGKTIDSMPTQESTDVLEVFAMKKPVWSFQYGPLLGYFHVMHDALGFRNTRTGQNWTMEWYELDQLFNCTFPHVLDDDSFKWCNQGALCVYDGIDDHTWTQYGILEKVSSISGDIFNKFGAWALNDNNTNVFYETWTVFNTSDITDKSMTMYFDSFDCASWVLRAFDSIYDLGGKFDGKVQLNYTRLNLYSYEPVKLGTYDDIINSKNQTLIEDIKKFYRDFQKPKTHFLEQFLDIFNYIEVSKRFYFYYNELYWYLQIKSPSIKITYYPIPLPGTTLN